MITRTFSFPIPRITAQKADGDYLWLAFDTSPATIVKIRKDAPSNMLQKITLPADYTTISEMDIAGTYLWALCNTSPGKVAIIHTTLFTVTELTFAYNNPKCIIFDSTQAYIGLDTSPAQIIIFNKTSRAFVAAVTMGSAVDGGCYSLVMEGSTYLWGCLYSTSNSDIFRMKVSDNSLSYYNIVGESKLNAISIDTLNNLWVGTDTSPAHMIKAYIEITPGTEIPTVSGSISPDMTGTYEPYGTYYGQPSYKHETQDYYLYYLGSPYADNWILGTEITETDYTKWMFYTFNPGVGEKYGYYTPLMGSGTPTVYDAGGGPVETFTTVSFPLSSGNNKIKSIYIDTDDTIYASLSEAIKLFIGHELSGEILDYDTYDVSGFGSIVSSPRIEKDTSYIWLAAQSNPGTLIQFDLRSVQTFLTNLTTQITKSVAYMTSLIYSNISNLIFDTDLRTFLTKKDIFKTDLRYRTDAYASITPKSLSDIIVKKDGTELLDVDYTTLKIQFNLNKTPSEASFVLGRRHDKLNYTLEDIYSEITNENKIEIFDGTIKLFTGYITNIDAESSSDTVSISARDIRYKINTKTLDLEYGGKYDSETNSIIRIDVTTALNTIFTEISTLITGHEDISFACVPEYTQSYSDCGSHLDSVLRNVANMNWYTDENEYLRFQKIENGNVKTLSLCGLNIQRHPYDVIIDNINLNKYLENYVETYDVKLGKKVTQQWTHQLVGLTGKNPVNTEGELIGVPVEITQNREAVLADEQLQNLSVFGFQNFYRQFGTIHRGTYFVGEDVSPLYGLGVVETNGFESVLFEGYWIYQYLGIDKNEDLDSIIVGSGTVKKTLYLTEYGKQINNSYWEVRKDEESIPTNGIVGTPPGDRPGNWDSYHDNWIYEIVDSSYDYTDYAEDAAKFELSHNNKLLTEANATILLDAYEYYNLSFKDLINFNNTIEADIYNNNNGFPLNISSITIDCSTRQVTMNLSNYGQTYYERMADITSKMTIKTEKKLYRQYSVFHYIPY